jgi:hypothetical protein
MITEDQGVNKPNERIATVYDEIFEVVKRAEADFQRYVNDSEGNVTDVDYHNHMVSYLAEWAQGKLGEQREAIADAIAARAPFVVERAGEQWERDTILWTARIARDFGKEGL